MVYLTRSFQKFVRKHGGFQKGGNPPHAATVTDVCHKCEKVGQFKRDHLMLKAENKEYQRRGGEKEKRTEPIPQKNARK